MIPIKSLSLVKVSLLGLFLASIQAFGQFNAEPKSTSSPLTPLGSLPTYDLPSLDVQALRAAFPEEKGVPLRIAQPYDLEESTLSAGAWEVTPKGEQVWRMRIYSPGATDLNFGFGNYALPEGAQLYIYSEDYAYTVGPFSQKNGLKHGEFWSPMVPGDRAVIELMVPAASEETPVLVLTRIAQGFRDFLNVNPSPARQDSCNIDVICPEADPWRDQVRSVGAYTVGGIDTCTGTMIMDVPNSFRNFFLTANHCGLGVGNAPSVVVYWNFESPNCGDLSGGVRSDASSGATFRAAKADVDMALIELDDDPEPSFNVFYAGWDRTGNAPNGSVGIHHPGVDEKAISFNDDALTSRATCIGGPSSPNTHWNVDNWELGTTERGSSGSAIFDPDNQLVVGFLSGGAASCTNIDFDCYGKFSVGWDSGTTAASRMQDWLDPSNTGTMTVQGSNPAPTIFFADFQATDRCGAVPGNGVWEPGETIEILANIRGTGDFTGIQGTLSTTTNGITVTSDMASFPNVAMNSTVTAQTPFIVDVAEDFTCFEEVIFTLTITSNEGGPFTSVFRGQVGQRNQPAPNAPLGDNTTTTIDFVVSEDLMLTDLNLFADINHSFVGDLEIRLRSPNNTEVTLLDRPGVPGSTNGCGDNDMVVTFDDDAVFDLEGHCPGSTPWYTGDAAPVQPLSAFNGESTAGTWQLIVVDHAGQDSGVINQWRLETTPPLTDTCTTCDSACASSNLAADAGMDDAVCEGQTYGLSVTPSGGTGPYMASWQPAALLDDPTSLTPIATITETTTFTVTINDGDGCFVQDVVVLEYIPEPGSNFHNWLDEMMPTLDFVADGVVDILDFTYMINANCPN